MFWFLSKNKEKEKLKSQLYNIDDFSDMDIKYLSKNLPEITRIGMLYNNYEFTDAHIIEALKSFKEIVSVRSEENSFKRKSLELFILSKLDLCALNEKESALCDVLSVEYFSILDKHGYDFKKHENSLSLSESDSLRFKELLKRDVSFKGNTKFPDAYGMYTLSKDSENFKNLLFLRPDLIEISKIELFHHQIEVLSIESLDKLIELGLNKNNVRKFEYSRLRSGDFSFRSDEWYGYKSFLSTGLMDINDLDEEGLHILSQLNSEQTLDWALNAGADINGIDSKGENVLYAIMKRNFILYGDKEKNIDYFDLLLKKGAKFELPENTSIFKCFTQIQPYFIPLLISKKLVDLNDLSIDLRNVDKYLRNKKDNPGEKLWFDYLVNEPGVSLKHIKLISHYQGEILKVPEELRYQLSRIYRNKDIDEVTGSGVNLLIAAIITGDAEWMKELLDKGSCFLKSEEKNKNDILSAFKNDYWFNGDKVMKIDRLSPEIYALLKEKDLLSNKGKKYIFEYVALTHHVIIEDAFKSKFYNKDNIRLKLGGFIDFRIPGLKEFILENDLINMTSFAGKNMLSFTSEIKYAEFLLENKIAITEDLDSYDHELYEVIKTEQLLRIVEEKRVLNEKISQDRQTLAPSLKINRI